MSYGSVIRFRGNTLVVAEDGEVRPAKGWVGAGGRAKMLRNAKITKKRFDVATVVCTQDKEVKQPWCLVSSRTKSDAQAFVKWYAKRWSIEASFRDLKNPVLGLGLERTVSLLRQGFYWNERVGSMKEEILLPLMTKFGELVQEHAVFKRVFGWT